MGMCPMPLTALETIKWKAQNGYDDTVYALCILPQLKSASPPPFLKMPTSQNPFTENFHILASELRIQLVHCYSWESLCSEQTDESMCSSGWAHTGGGGGGLS